METNKGKKPPPNKGVQISYFVEKKRYRFIQFTFATSGECELDEIVFRCFYWTPWESESVKKESKHAESLLGFYLEPCPIIRDINYVGVGN